MNIQVTRKTERYRFIFTVESNEPITREEAMKIQTRMGYNPEGYGFGRFTLEKGDKLAYQGSWSCSQSCD